MPEPTPEAWAQIRHEYENTDRSIVDICFEHDITTPMLRYRVKVWNWQRRRPFVPRNGPPPVAIEAILHPPTRAALARARAQALEGEGRRAASQARCEPGWGDASAQQVHPTPLRLADASRSDPPPPGEGKEGSAPESEENIVPRLQSAVARVLPAIEATIARLSAGPHHPREMEQAGRTLSSLTRTLRELNGLLAEHNARPTRQCDCCDDMPEDMDAFREQLAVQIENFLASRDDEAFE
jgi:hypothetical protein